MGAREWIDYVDLDDGVVTRGLRGGAAAAGLAHRVAATICRDAEGRCLVYRRPAAATVYPGHHDVLVGGSVRAGEGYLAAAKRELHEELGVRAEPAELSRSLVDDPSGPCFLAVHHTVLTGVLRPNPTEIAWWAFVPLEDLVAGNVSPMVPAGREALRRLTTQEPPARPLPPSPGGDTGPSRRSSNRQAS